MPLKIVPKITKRTPKATILGQDGAKDRQEDPQEGPFLAKIVAKIAKRSPKGTILGSRWCP